MSVSSLSVSVTRRWTFHNLQHARVIFALASGADERVF